MNKDVKAISTSKELDSADVILLRSYLMRNKNQEHFEGHTYAQILEEARSARELHPKLSTQSQPDEAEKLKNIHTQKLRKSLEVSLIGKGFKKADWQSYITLKFTFHNNTTKDIRAFKGKVIFTDLFDDKLGELELTYDQIIPAGINVNWETKMDYNQYLEKDSYLRSKTVDDLKTKWEPEKIIFTDNSTL